MKVAVIVFACLVAGACAQDTGSTATTDFLTQLKNTLKTTVDHVKENGKNALQTLLGQVTQSGSQLLQTTLLKLLEGLGTQAPGKRDLATLEEVRAKLQEFLEKMKAKKTEAKGVMEKGMSKLQAVIEKIKNLSFLKQHISKTEKEIDDAVQHHVVVTRRFIEGLTDSLLETLKNSGSKLAQELLAQVLAGLTTGQGKRELHPAVQSLVDFFKPHVDTIVGSVGSLGETLKGHANSLWNTVQTHAGQLQGKLQGHVDELKKHGQTLLGHGKTAVDALKAAVTDILNQTLTNAKGTIGEAGKSVGEASKVVTNHLVDALKNGAN